jgi:Tol biopolymer transport system component
MRRRITLVSVAATAVLGSMGVAASTARATAAGGSGLIAFSTGADGSDPTLTSQIFTIRPDGSGLRQVTHVRAGKHALNPGFSATGKKIAFESDVTGNFEIWVMNADGSGQTELTRNQTFANFHPRWSPNGTTIAFTRCTFPFGVADCHIAVISSNGGPITELTSGHWADGDSCGSAPNAGSGNPVGGPEYSPDGSKIAFDSNRGGLESAVWVMNANGTNLRRLTAPSLEAFWPDWSPQGGQIAFTNHACVPGSDIWAMHADGTGGHALTHLPSNHNAGFESYAPDGSRIVLTSDLLDPNAATSAIFVMNADGSGLHAILTTQPSVLLVDWGRSG